MTVRQAGEAERARKQRERGSEPVPVQELDSARRVDGLGPDKEGRHRLLRTR